MSDPAIFQVLAPGEGNPPPAELAQLGLWQPAPAARAYAEGGELPGLVWRAHLPADGDAAALALAAHDRTLFYTAQALHAAGPLLNRDLRQSQTAGAAQAYALMPGVLAVRRGILARALNPQASGLAFGLQDDLAQAGEIVSRFAGQVTRLVEQFALVESSHSGRRAARTRVEWLGDVHTWWTPGHSPAALADHRRVLGLALATRQAWLRLILAFTAGAAKIALAMGATPFNPIAVWAAWNYVQTVLKHYHSLQQAGQAET